MKFNINWIWKVRSIIGKVTDFLIAGRNKGLWQKGQGPDV